MRILFLELGVGANTPGIIKYPFWQMTMQNPNAGLCLPESEGFGCTAGNCRKVHLYSGRYWKGAAVPIKVKVSSNIAAFEYLLKMI